ncbi:MAG: nucleotidyltransferase domain-containing protein [Clostridia bacterium]|nr:nucleotidyltransferase domain-containing protein [Clostridia bacterium]
MLTITQITKAVEIVANEFNIKRVCLFGSYAENRNTEKSDVDLLVEFFIPVVSLFTLVDVKNRLQDILGVEIDIIHAPLPENALISPEKVVEVYAA